jgi:hypothetical protein
LIDKGGTPSAGLAQQNERVPGHMVKDAGWRVDLSPQAKDESKEF